MTLQSSLTEHKALVDEALANFFQKKSTDFSKIDLVLVDMLSKIRAQTLRSGKRIRPFLAKIGYELSEGKDRNEAVQLGVALELMHQFFLVHDDIVDRDDKRYDGDSLHIVYQKEFHDVYAQTNTHLGMSLGMIAGDLLQTLATDQIMSLSGFLELKHVLLHKMLQTIYETTAGWQIHYFLNFTSLEQVTEERFLKGMELVSARYTFEAPLIMGCILAGSEKYLPALKQYAFHTGMAFQMRDDVLGMFGDTTTMGKPTGNDYREGKKTLLVMHTYKNASLEQKKFLLETLGKEIDQATLSQAKSLMQDTGALEYAEKKAREHALKAKESLALLPESPQKDWLYDLADYVVERDH